jgi:hypothetical protein
VPAAGTIYARTFRNDDEALSGQRRNGRVTLRRGGEWQNDEILNADI